MNKAKRCLASIRVKGIFMKKSIKALALAAVLALSLGALAGCSSNSSSSDDLGLVNEGKLTIVTSPDYPPFENLNDDGEAEGFEIALAGAIADKMGLELQVETMQFDGIVTAIAAGGKYDMGITGLSVTPERAAQINFTNSYYVDDLSCAVMKDSGITSDSVDADLNKKGVVIAVQSGTTGEAYAQENYPKATIKAYGNSNDCFAALNAGQANAALTNAAVVASMLNSYTDAEIVKSVATGEEYAAAINLDNQALLDAVNAAITELQEDGTIDELLKEWM